MGAYNGRLMPRLIFGLPIQAVVVAGIAFVCLIFFLFPSSQLHIFRPFFLCGCVLLLLRVYRIMKTATETAILSALDKSKRLRRAQKIID